MANAYAPSYSSLTAEIQDICENTNAEFVANIPRFIQRGQDQVQKDLGLSIWDASTTVSLTTAGTMARDAGWLIVRSLWLPVQRKWIVQRGIDYVRGYGGIGRPKVWAEDGETSILIGPTPNSTYPVLVSFYQRLTALSVSNEANWITRNAGDMLLMQALINAHLYLINPEAVQQIAGLYQMIQQQAINELRDGERTRYEPMRAAPRPVMQPGGVA